MIYPEYGLKNSGVRLLTQDDIPWKKGKQFRAKYLPFLKIRTPPAGMHLQTFDEQVEVTDMTLQVTFSKDVLVTSMQMKNEHTLADPMNPRRILS